MIICSKKCCKNFVSLFYFLMIGEIVFIVWVTLVNCPILVMLILIFVFVFHKKVRNMKEKMQGNKLGSLSLSGYGN